MGPLLFAVVTFALLWVLFILPQQRRMRAHQALVAQLAVGDEVVTSGGLLGTIVDLDDEVVQLEVAEGMVVRVARAAIGRRIEDEVAADATASDTDIDADIDTEPVEPPAEADT